MCVFLNLSSLSPTVWQQHLKRGSVSIGSWGSMYDWPGSWSRGAGTWGSLSHPGCKQWAESTGWMQPDYIEPSRPTLKGQLSPGSTTSLNSSSWWRPGPQNTRANAGEFTSKVGQLYTLVLKRDWKEWSTKFSCTSAHSCQGEKKGTILLFTVLDSKEWLCVFITQKKKGKTKPEHSNLEIVLTWTVT